MSAASAADAQYPFTMGGIGVYFERNKQISKILPNGALPELEKLYWDTALAFTDSSKIVFGSDFPFAPKIAIPGGLKSLRQESTKEDLASILSGSALRLMPSLA